ncbi:conserved hypothetical protein [Flavobacterium psychrophilum]|uniref:type II toxin-antitoxin system RelE/ParE family toxin n=1 Tax=Flavobacterium psychrophilum TaxID=96345 RepID=UPI000B7C39BD|nr:type II toxin-antitoxin system RelE/ParE family toxin [Flavobacterium psychrophilum]SNB29621.1 conserved hypothetical protein [Flavobacterium psychrophilum]
MRNIIFSKNAQVNLDDLLQYLEFKFSLRTQSEFIKKLDKVIFLIQSDPEIFSFSKVNKNYRRCVLSKQTTLYYKFDNKEINVLALFRYSSKPKQNQ